MANDGEQISRSVIRITVGQGLGAHAWTIADKVWFLRRLNLFDGMTEAEIEEVSHDLKMRSCAPRHAS